jgi:two-component system, cell cycle sensor histidine kinase and response regulator CckA
MSNGWASITDGKVPRGHTGEPHDDTSYSREDDRRAEMTRTDEPKTPVSDEPQKNEHALRASEVRYRRVFEAAKDGILILDGESGAILDVNPYLMDLLGYCRNDLLGRQIWDLGPFKDIVASKAAFAKLQANDYIAYDDLPLLTLDGRRIDVGFVSNAYLVDGMRMIQCNIRDNTQRKRADKARSSLEEQVRVSQRMEALGALAGGVAHDFNNLLSVILCYTGFAREGLPAENPARDDLDEVEKAGKRAAALTHQLLAFSRKQVMQPVPLDLNLVVEGIERLLRRILGEDIELVHTLTPNLGLTMADPAQIEQVLMNLVVNARDAMPNGGKLTIETAKVDLDSHTAGLQVGVTPGAYVMLSVTDTGCGMDAKTRERIFEPFFTTKLPPKGTGLGLSTVYGIVKQSGGNIWVYSEPEHGTTFKVCFPRDLSRRRPTYQSSSSRLSAVRVGTETILLVEDEAAVRTLAQRILSSAGYTVLTASNGREAFLLCESFKGDLPLVVTDVVMPLLGGRAFATQLRKIRPATKVLFVSGYSDDALSTDGVLEEGNRFLGKPFNAAQLTRTVREMLDEGRPEPSVPGNP